MIIKKLVPHFRTSMKLIVLLSVAVFIILSAIFMFYKPTYAVSYNGQFLGYTDSKSMLQSKINEYIKNGDGNSNVAFVQIDQMPEYKMCLLKKDIQTNDAEIYDRIVKNGVYYYKYYCVLLDGKDQFNVATYEEAQNVLTKLKEKDSNNINKISVVERYNTNLVEFASVDTCVEKLYEKKVVAKPTKVNYGYVGSVGSSSNVNNTSQKVNIGIELITPVSGTISCTFGRKSGYYHTGLDIAAPKGRPIKAAAAGTVTSAGYHYSYGYLVIISHGNGVQTYYAHCSQLNVSVGQTVSQGQTVGLVGSTGNSTGNHLHFEVRINGKAQNPQNYI